MRITINIIKPEQVNQVPYLRQLVQLSHIANALGFMLQQTVQEKTGSPRSERDTAYALIYLSSLLYESMNRAESLLKKMADILPKFILGEVAWVFSEVATKTSFCNTVLASIRNQFGFHFADGLIKNSFEDTIPHFPPVLAQGENPDGKDLVFVLPTDIFVNYLATLGDQSKPDDQRVNELIGRVADYTSRMLRVIHTSIMAIAAQDGSDYTVQDNTA